MGFGVWGLGFGVWGLGMEATSATEKCIEAERLILMKHDAYAFPVDIIVDKKLKRRKQVELPQETPLDYIPEIALEIGRAHV